jgi:hypothetical protein
MEGRYDAGDPAGAKMMRLLLAATLALGVGFVPVVLAKEIKPAASKLRRIERPKPTRRAATCPRRPIR